MKVAKNLRGSRPLKEEKLTEKQNKKGLLLGGETEPNFEQYHGTGASKMGLEDNQESQDEGSQDPKVKGNTGK